jgi:hypothetical protein
VNVSEWILVAILRIVGFAAMSAIVPVFMPHAWMDACHDWLGLGPLPETPIIVYLTRSLSAMYAMHGALVLFISCDVRRFLPIVKCLAALGILFGAGMIALDCAVDMPLFWTLCEGPFVIVLGSAGLWLAGRVQRRPAAAC